ncbi:MAG: hypothetical protein ND895_16550 [Pyrinomonadaceae bacterium]|nr:hypothetical protein [Pyrinomonadaceae bacterium]
MIWKDGLSALAAVLLLLISLGVGVRGQTASPLVPLEGLDPVELINGKEVGGKMAISVTRGRFQYIFASQENKAIFEKDPARYEIQLEGSCARMGRGVTGNPDLYSVYKERIYIFGSDACVLAFKSSPESYLEPAASKFAPSAEALKKGQDLITKAVEAMGGAAKVDGLVSYQEKAITKNAQGEVAGQIVVTRGFPDRYRSDRMTGANAFSSVVAPNESFILAQKQTFPMIPEQRKNVERNFKRSPLELLRARTGADFKAAVFGPGEAGIEQVAVELEGALMTLGIDPTTGRILTLSYSDRAPNHMFGNITLTYSDFRAVDGLTLPFKVTATINGSPSPPLSREVESITVNGKLDPTLFERPKTAAGG